MDEVARTIAGLEERQRARQGGQMGILGNAMAALPAGSRDIRPLRPGEFRQNDDGSRSTELSVTVTNPALNQGQPTNIPSLYMENGSLVLFDNDDEVVDAALATGLTFPTFNTIEEAVAAARQRSDAGGIAQGALGGLQWMR
jgi:hypothetical protein